jgi:phospholipase C
MDQWHPGWHSLAARVAPYRMTRRQMLRGVALGAAGLAALPMVRGARARAGGLGGPVTPGVGLPDQARWNPGQPIKHVVVLCQENRSFDHYFGAFASQLGATGFDSRPPLRYRTRNGAASQAPFHLGSFCDDDPDHTWAGSQAKFAGGAMDGFLRAEDDVPRALGYYDRGDHLYHVDLARAMTLADHNFCSQVGPTLPNRLYLWTGTSGFTAARRPTGRPGTGLPYDNPPFTQPPPLLDWPTMADVLDAARLPWRSYTVADGSVPNPIGAFNPLIFFKSIQSSPRKLLNALAGIERFFVDLALGQLPAVSWIVTEALVSEHPPAPPDFGQLLVARVVRALMESTAWDSTVMFLTYDEGGGYFDHVPPPPGGLEVDTRTGLPVGPGFRVPMTIVSPYSRPGRVFSDPLDHTSILQFIERTFGLPQTLPIAPVRRHAGHYAHLEDALDTTRHSPSPRLPDLSQLLPLAKETVLSVDVHRGVVECGTTVPRWLPSLLGQPPLTPFPYPKSG